jgi:rubrerythrin
MTSPNTPHDETSACIDRVEQELCEWAYDGGDADTGVPGAWVCKTCGTVDINREPPGDS